MAGKNDDESLIVPGIKPVTERIAAAPSAVDRVYIDAGRRSPDISRLRSLCEKNGVKYDLVGTERLEKLCRGSGHQGAALRLRCCAPVQYEDLLVDACEAPVPLIVALDGVLDPGNVGTLARTLYALGAAGIVFPRHNSAYLG
ncbi:MAG: RNA methyltransferase, partial [Mailhella sp.]|nr:RNA methyltransferase [Mailhella sp.]